MMTYFKLEMVEFKTLKKYNIEISEDRLKEIIKGLMTKRNVERGVVASITDCSNIL